MQNGHGIEQTLGAWRQAQQLFWEAAARAQPVPDASAFSSEPWQSFDGFWSDLVQGSDGTASGAGVGRAGLAYQRLIAEAWARVQADFDVHRRALRPQDQPAPDWRLLRRRWFDIAEAEFLRLQRSPAYLAAQRDALRAAIEWRKAQPAGVRDGLAGQRAAAAGGSRLLRDTVFAGIRIAATAKDEVWRDRGISVSRYRALAPRTRGPVLICHGLIGRQTMTDLRPDRSMVRNLLANGVDVFVLDWGNAAPEDNVHGFEYYADTMLGAAIDAVLRTVRCPRLTLLGICQGGTLAACHGAAHPEKLSGLITAGAPFDFHADGHDADPAHGLLNVWVRSLERQDLLDLIDVNGNVPGDFLGSVFSQLNPIRSLAKYAVRMLDSVDAAADLELFLAMEKWLADRPDLPGELAKAWLIDLYHANALAEGTFRMSGEVVRLDRLTMPILNIFATDDHITPPPCSRALGAWAGHSGYRELALPTGHIGMFVSARAQTLLAPAIVRWLDQAITGTDVP